MDFELDDEELKATRNIPCNKKEVVVEDKGRIRIKVDTTKKLKEREDEER